MLNLKTKVIIFAITQTANKVSDINATLKNRQNEIVNKLIYLSLGLGGSLSLAEPGKYIKWKYIGR